MDDKYQELVKRIEALERQQSEHVKQQDIFPATIKTRHLDDEILEDYATLMGIETLTNKTMSGASNTFTLLPAANLLIGSQTIGDLLYASSTSAWARLGITTGAFLGESGGVPAWLTLRYKVGTADYDLTTASGTVAFTGVGFKPKALLFFTTVQSSTAASWGMDDGTVASSVRRIGANYTNSATRSLFYDDGSGNTQDGYVTTLGSDGFTITWAKANSPTGTLRIMYLAFR